MPAAQASTSTGGKRLPIWSSSSSAVASERSTSASSASSSSRPAAAAPNSVTLLSPMPSVHAVAERFVRRDAGHRARRPAAVGEEGRAGQRMGSAAGPAQGEEPVRRPGCRAPWAVSAAASATRRPGCGDDSPYPGLEWTTVRSPRAAAASASPGGSSAAPGVPWWKTRTSPASGPETSTSRSRPSGVRMVRAGQSCRSAGSSVRLIELMQ